MQAAIATFERGPLLPTVGPNPHDSNTTGKTPATMPVEELVDLYAKLTGGVAAGWVLGRLLPAGAAARIGQFLFWFGVPVGVVAFVRQADLSGGVWLAPVAAWLAIALGAALAWGWLRWRPADPAIADENGGEDVPKADGSRSDRAEAADSQRGSFLLASMFGNTGYLGYPVSLALVGEKYFGWALFYDLVGTTIGSYGLGVMMAASLGAGPRSLGRSLRALATNPTLWGAAVGVASRAYRLPDPVETGLQRFAWAVVSLALVLIGMRLSRLKVGAQLRSVAASLTIKMLLVPLLLGTILAAAGVRGAPLLVVVLQMAMPPAFATLVIAEAYALDRELSVAAVAVGSVGLLLTLPVWVFLFG